MCCMLMIGMLVYIHYMYFCSSAVEICYCAGHTGFKVLFRRSVQLPLALFPGSPFARNYCMTFELECEFKGHAIIIVQ